MRFPYQRDQSININNTKVEDPLLILVQRSKDKTRISDSIMFLLQEDLWRPVNHKNAETQEKFEEEMMDLGFINISNFTYGR